jgi:hypothetical protein
MSFKDTLARDISSVFLNTEEFSDKVYIDMGAGRREITVSLDTETMSHNANLDELDRTSGDLVFFVSASEFKDKFGVLPMAGDALRFNAVPCTVIKAPDTCGVLTVTLAFSA